MRSLERDLSEVALASGFNATIRNFSVVVFFCVFELSTLRLNRFIGIINSGRSRLYKEDIVIFRIVITKVDYKNCKVFF